MQNCNSSHVGVPFNPAKHSAKFGTLSWGWVTQNIVGLSGGEGGDVRPIRGGRLTDERGADDVWNRRFFGGVESEEGSDWITEI